MKARHPRAGRGPTEFLNDEVEDDAAVQEIADDANENAGVETEAIDRSFQ